MRILAGNDEISTGTEQRQFVERRRKPDILVRSVMVIAVIGWLSAVAALVMLDRARPVGENFFTRFFDVTVVSSWNTSLLRWAFAAIMASLIASALGLIVSVTRKRRKSDRYSKLLIALSIVSALLLILFILSYATHL